MQEKKVQGQKLFCLLYNLIRPKKNFERLDPDASYSIGDFRDRWCQLRKSKRERLVKLRVKVAHHRLISLASCSKNEENFVPHVH